MRAAERRQVGAGAGAELEQHGLAAWRARMMSSMLSSTRLDEAGRGLRELVRGSRAARIVWVSRSQRQLQAAPFTPYWWYRPTLNQTGELKAPCWWRQSHGEVAVEPFAVVGRGEVAVLDAPVG